MRQALLEITSKRFGCVGIVNEKKSLIGIITDGDLRRNIKKDFLEYAVKRIMTKNPIIIDENSSIYDAIILMNKYKITALFVANKKNRIPYCYIIIPSIIIIVYKYHGMRACKYYSKP